MAKKKSSKKVAKGKKLPSVKNTTLWGKHITVGG